jgi:hypothetical protein
MRVTISTSPGTGAASIFRMLAPIAVRAGHLVAVADNLGASPNRAMGWRADLREKFSARA